jgi:hypothetical protein
VQSLLQWERNKYYILQNCVFAVLGIQREMHEHHIAICGLSSSTIFSTLIHKWNDFRKKLLNIKCEFLFSLKILCETFLILRKIQRDITINVHKSSYKVPIILVQF